MESLPEAHVTLARHASVCLLVVFELLVAECVDGMAAAGHHAVSGGGEALEADGTLHGLFDALERDSLDVQFGLGGDELRVETIVVSETLLVSALLGLVERLPVVALPLGLGPGKPARHGEVGGAYGPEHVAHGYVDCIRIVLGVGGRVWIGYGQLDDHERPSHLIVLVVEHAIVLPHDTVSRRYVVRAVVGISDAGDFWAVGNDLEHVAVKHEVDSSLCVEPDVAVVAIHQHPGLLVSVWVPGNIEYEDLHEVAMCGGRMCLDMDRRAECSRGARGRCCGCNGCLHGRRTWASRIGWRRRGCRAGFFEGEVNVRGGLALRGHVVLLIGFVFCVAGIGRDDDWLSCYNKSWFGRAL